MGLFKPFSKMRRWWNAEGTVRRYDDRHDRASSLRICRIEQLESRQMMAADLHLGSVEYEPHQGLDKGVGNTIQVTFDGGAAGTQLTHLVIDGNKLLDGLQKDGDIFFDTASGGLGVYGFAPLVTVAHAGFNITNVSAIDGSSQIEFDFSGFTAGMSLTFTVDADVLETATVLGAAATVDGNEFENSHILGTFTAPHYQDLTLTAKYYDLFDQNFADADAQTGTQLNLPPDSYLPNTLGENDTPLDETVFTSGAVAFAPQVPLPASLSGRVWNDPNLNLTQDSGEPGIAGVQLTLLQWNGSQYVSTGLTQTTDANGDYKFSNLLPGQYQVVETQPAGYIAEGDLVGNVNGVTDGATAGPNVITNVVLQGGDDSVHNDFAEAQPAELCGYVYHDRNNNGLLEAGEEGIANVAVTITPIHSLDPNQQSVTVFTDANGFYCAEGLSPGEYQVTDVTPSGWLIGLDTAGTAGGTAHNPGDQGITGIILAGGQDGDNYNFGKLLPATLSGKVYSDPNQDCVYDSGDTLLSGVTIQLLNNQGVVIGTTQTDANGQYSFTGLLPGAYQVREIQPDGYIAEAAMVGTVGGTALDKNDIGSIALVAEDNGQHYDFCEIQPASLSGKVYNDLNQDCIYNGNDVLLSGVTIQLLDSQGNIVGTTQTDENGQYSFTNLVPGTYHVQALQPDGYFAEAAMAGTVGGTVLDKNDISAITLAPGDDGLHYDFCELQPATISGKVYVDPNQNCVYDDGDTLLSGVTVQLLDQNGALIGTTQTDEQGAYEFTGLLPGIYQVREVQPDGYIAEAVMVGTVGGTVLDVNDISSITLVPAADGQHYDFCEIQPASIRGMVVWTPDGDCTTGETETPISNVLLELLNSDGQIVATTTTDEAGNYLFDNLTPGTYSVQEVQPVNFLQGTTMAGSVGGDVTVDLISDIVLPSGTDAVNYNYCEMPPVTLSGYVFQDGPTIYVPYGQSPPSIPSVRDGIKTPDDAPISGVILHLADSAGNTVTDVNGTPVIATTDANGFYQFTGLPPGLYTVVEGAPAGYVPGLDVAGSTGGIAINRYNVNSFSVLNLLSTLSIDPNQDALVRIPVPAGQDSVNNNFSVVQIIELPPPPPPPPPPPHYPPPPPAPPAPPVVINQIVPPPVIRAYYIPPVVPVYVTSADYASHTEGWTWHLSVINGGSPRSADDTDESLVRLINTQMDVFALNGNGIDMQRSTWTLNDGTIKAPTQYVFGIPGAIPITGDFAGDGITRIGVYIDGEWFIDMNGNGIWDAGDLYLKLGTAADKPVVGDWDGDGKADIGIFGPRWALDPRQLAREPGLPDPHNPPTGKKKNMPPTAAEATNGVRAIKLGANGKVRADFIDHVFEYGSPGDVPVAGDWDGTGIARIGVFRHGRWYLDMDGNGKWSAGDVAVEFGQDGDIPVVGDWTGDGVTKIGVYRKGKWILDTNNNRQIDALDKVFELGGADDLPVVGDWDGSGKTSVGVYHNGVIERRTVANQ